MDIEKLVYCSVLHPYISRLPHHRSKLECVSPSKVELNLSIYRRHATQGRGIHFRVWPELHHTPGE
jgi:hypothetical protein